MLLLLHEGDIKVLMRDNGILSIALNVSRTAVNQMFWIVISEEETGKQGQREQGRHTAKDQGSESNRGLAGCDNPLNH